MPESGKPAETMPVASPAGGPLAGLAKAVATLRDPKMWLRIGMFTVGFTLTYVAIWKLTGDNRLSDASKTVIKVGAAVVTKKVK